MNYYAALDVSLRSVHLRVIDDQGELITETKLSSEVTDIIAYLDALELEVSVVGLEAGTLAQYLTYGLQSAGFEMMVCSYYLLLLIKFLTCCLFAHSGNTKRDWDIARYCRMCRILPLVGVALPTRVQARQ